MSLKTCTIVALLVSFAFHRSFSQRGTTYISYDTTASVGLKLSGGSDRDNARFITEIKGDRVIKHTSDEISEYGLGDGRIYKAFTIDGTRYFLERLAKDRYSVYYLVDKNKNRSFYITTGDSVSLIRIPEAKQARISLLTDYTPDCIHTEKNIRYVKLTKNSIARFFSDYQVCAQGYLPRIRYELNAGVTLNKFAASKKAEVISVPGYQYNPGFFVSAYADLPVGRSNYSLVTGVMFDRYTRAGSFKANGDVYDLLTDQWRLNVPVLVRYTFFDLKSCPFIEGGILYSRRIKGETTLFRYEQTENDVFTYVDKTPVITDNQGGFSLGSGMIFNYGARRSYIAHIAYNKLYSMADHDTLNVNEFLFSLGLLF